MADITGFIPCPHGYTTVPCPDCTGKPESIASLRQRIARLEKALERIIAFNDSDGDISIAKEALTQDSAKI